MSKIRKLLSREKIVNNLKRLGELRIKITHTGLLQFSILILILVLAFTIRLLPMRWGYYLSEFDPYWQYRLTKDIVQNGYLHWTTWQDTMSWWPWGKDVARNSYPGLALTAATFYTVLNALGVPMKPTFTMDPLASDPVYNFVIIFPVIMAVLTCLVIYFFGKYVGGKEVGLFAALFLALNASYISRTYLGFFDDETVGIFGILLYSLFFLRSIEVEKSRRSSLLYAVAAGLSLGYVLISWGASRYPVGLTLVFVLIMLLLGRYSTRLLVSYGVSFGIALFIAINLPYLGFWFLLEYTNVAVLGLFLLLCVFEVFRRIKTLKMKIILTLGLVILSSFLILALYWSGYVRPLEAKFMSVLNPFERLVAPILSSVQEHRPAAWGSLYYDIGIGIFFIPVGLFFAAQNPTNRNLYLILFGLTSMYFASTMIRLTLILAPAFCLLWALALTRLLRPFITVMKETPIQVRRKMRFEAHVGKEFSGAFLILIFLLLIVTFVLPSRESALGHTRIFDQAYTPTTMAVSSLTLRPDQMIPDWIDALAWMRYNLPPDAVIISWWDYGYWITTVADRYSLADNGTFNWTQIERIGRMFMSNETEALKILEDFNQQAQERGWSNKITHVVAFFTFNDQGQNAGYGDESKWMWMANIADNNLDAWKDYGNYSLGIDWQDINKNGQAEQEELIYNPKGQNATICKLMMWGKKQRVSAILAEEPQYFKLVYYSQKGKSSFVTAGGIHALVVVYEVVYP